MRLHSLLVGYRAMKLRGRLCPGEATPPDLRVRGCSSHREQCLSSDPREKQGSSGGSEQNALTLWEWFSHTHPPTPSPECPKNRLQKKRRLWQANSVIAYFPLMLKAPMERENPWWRQDGWNGKGWKLGCDVLTDRKEALGGKPAQRMWGDTAWGVDMCMESMIHIADKQLRWARRRKGLNVWGGQHSARVGRWASDRPAHTPWGFRHG